MAKKTWAGIRSETVNLGFEKFKAYEKNKDSYVAAYNYAQEILASTVSPILHAFTLNKEGKGLKTIDLEKLCEDEQLSYIGVASIGVLNESGERIDGAVLLQNKFLNIPSEFVGTFVVYARIMPQPILTNSPDDTAVEIQDKWANLMPYLMANRLYMDDNPSMAGYYYNLYDESRKAILEADNTPFISVLNSSEEGWW